MDDNFRILLHMAFLSRGAQPSIKGKIFWRYVNQQGILECVRATELSNRRSSYAGRSTKKVTRAFKMEDDLDREISWQAKKKSITTSSLINQILRRYTDWYQYIGHGSNFLTLDKEMFASFLYEISEEKLIEIARSSALVSIHSFLQFRYPKINLDTIMDYFSNLSSYSNLGEINIIDEGHDRFEIHIRHPFGMKWSIFQAEYISGILSSFLEMQTTTEVSPLSCSISAVRKKE